MDSATININMAKIVLIIEDDTFIQGLEATKLIKKGYAVLSANDSIGAFKILDVREDIDLVLLDILLPGEDGFTILKKIREKKMTQKIPVIVFSNLSAEKDIKQAIELGANEFMIKSNFTLDDLAEKVKDLIGN
ncbi:MAG: response regulator [Candidatus Paceibacterota bacterium]